MGLEIGLIGTEKMAMAFKIAGLGTTASTVYAFDQHYDLEALRLAFASLTGRSDVGLVLIAENLFEVLADEIEEHKKTLPIIQRIPSRF